MTTKDIINTIVSNAGVSKKQAQDILHGLADIVAAELVVQGAITLHGIGTITVVDTPARPGRNPQTGEAIEIPAGKRIKLKAAKALKDAVAA